MRLSVVPGTSRAETVRAIRWFNLAHSLGMHAPLVVLQDLGHLLLGVAPAASGAPALLPKDQGLDELREAYHTLVSTIATSEVCHRCAGLRLDDGVIAVLLTKVLAPIYGQWRAPDKAARVGQPLPQAPLPDAGAVDDAPLDAGVVSYVRTLVAYGHRVRHGVEQLDIDTLRLVGLFHGIDTPSSTLELLDLSAMFSMPMVNDVVNFSLQLIPSVLETARRRDAQTASFDGIEGVERIGALDSLVPSELAHDHEIFLQKVIDNELFFYARSRAREEPRKLYYVLIDASASMRGQRTVFARGVALAMLKKLLLQGERPRVRFFDSRLHSIESADPGLSVAAMLAFRSERGRNYQRVFTELVHEVRRAREESGDDVVVTLLTHGQCHAPRNLVARLREWAHLRGIFILPSGPLELDYLDLLHDHAIIDANALSTSATQRQAALAILARI